VILVHKATPETRGTRAREIPAQPVTRGFRVILGIKAIRAQRAIPVQAPKVTQESAIQVHRVTPVQMATPE